jgi:hypothetical protein
MDLNAREVLQRALLPSAIVYGGPACRATYGTALKAGSGGLRPYRPHEGFYHWSDLAVGINLAIYGFHLVLAEVDEATQQFYRGHAASSTPAGPPVESHTCLSASCHRYVATILTVHGTSAHCLGLPQWHTLRGFNAPAMPYLLVQHAGNKLHLHGVRPLNGQIKLHAAQHASHALRGHHGIGARLRVLTF